MKIADQHIDPATVSRLTITHRDGTLDLAGPEAVAALAQIRRVPAPGPRGRPKGPARVSEVQREVACGLGRDMLTVDGLSAWTGHSIPSVRAALRAMIATGDVVEGAPLPSTGGAPRKRYRLADR